MSPLFNQPRGEDKGKSWGSTRPDALKRQARIETASYCCGGAAVLLESLLAFFDFLLFLAFFALVCV